MELSVWAYNKYIVCKMFQLDSGWKVARPCHCAFQPREHHVRIGRRKHAADRRPCGLRPNLTAHYNKDIAVQVVPQDTSCFRVRMRMEVVAMFCAKTVKLGRFLSGH